MSSRTLSSVLRSRASIFKPQQSQPIPRVSCAGLGQTRSYAPNHDDPFGDDSDAPPPQHGLLNPKLRSLINSVPLDQKVRYIKDGSGDTHPTADAALLDAIFKPTILPYTVGTDICHVPRLHRLITSQMAEPKYIKPAMPRIWTRVLTPLEARYSGWKSSIDQLDSCARFIAGRWAAKEAIIKAFSAAYPALDKIFMHDIVILNSKVQMGILEARKAASRISARGDGPPLPLPQGWESAPELVGRAPRAFVRVPVTEVGWVEVSMSISHDGEYATATALVPVDPKIKEAKKEKSFVRAVIDQTHTDARYT